VRCSVVVPPAVSLPVAVCARPRSTPWRSRDRPSALAAPASVGQRAASVRPVGVDDADVAHTRRSAGHGVLAPRSAPAPQARSRTECAPWRRRRPRQRAVQRRVASNSYPLPCFAASKPRLVVRRTAARRLASAASMISRRVQEAGEHSGRARRCDRVGSHARRALCLARVTWPSADQRHATDRLFFLVDLELTSTLPIAAAPTRQCTASRRPGGSALGTGVDSYAAEPSTQPPPRAGQARACLGFDQLGIGTTGAEQPASSGSSARSAVTGPAASGSSSPTRQASTRRGRQAFDRAAGSRGSRPPGPHTDGERPDQAPAA
jgi:hypothetical protein